jgi:hypothetical protein
MHCPVCKRETYYPNRAGAISTRPKDAPKTAVRAELRNGTCTKCRRIQKGYRRMSSKGVMSKSQKTARAKLNLQQEREALNSMVRARRRRGVPEDGISPAEWAEWTRSPLVTTVTRCYHG